MHGHLFDGRVKQPCIIDVTQKASILITIWILFCKVMLLYSFRKRFCFTSSGCALASELGLDQMRMSEKQEWQGNSWQRSRAQQSHVGLRVGIPPWGPSSRASRP